MVRYTQDRVEGKFLKLFRIYEEPWGDHSPQLTLAQPQRQRLMARIVSIAVLGALLGKPKQI
jgi:hypothetical protein